MDTRKLKNSGILEMYVLQLLPKQKRKKIEALIGGNEELKAEVEAIEIALHTYASFFAVAAPRSILENF